MAFVESLTHFAHQSRVGSRAVAHESVSLQRANASTLTRVWAAKRTLK